MNGSLKTVLLEHFNANAVHEAEVIQSIWSNYGTISRWQLVGADVNSVIVKCISVPSESNHPRGWNTPISHQRKVRSYEVEMAWYKELAAKTNRSCRTPKCYVSTTLGAERVLVLEDLDSGGFELSAEEAKICLT